MILLLKGPDEAHLRTQLQEATRRADPRVAAFEIVATRERATLVVASSRFGARIFGWLAGCGIALTISGLYALTSHVISLRSRDIKIMKALGARSSDIYRAVLRELRPLVLRGLVMGMFFGSTTAFVLRRALVDISPVDWVTLTGVCATVCSISILACLFPAMAANRESALGILRL
jgi:ABC-type antimicrobial peptide transport system permease subunit